MKKIALIATLLVSPLALASGDPESGQDLYDNTEFTRSINGEMRDDVTCATCHQPSFYTRKDRLASSFKNLEQAWVQGCNDTMNVGWFPEEVTDVATYLNRKYYHFDE